MYVCISAFKTLYVFLYNFYLINVCIHACMYVLTLCVQSLESETGKLFFTRRGISALRWNLRISNYRVWGGIGRQSQFRLFVWICMYLCIWRNVRKYVCMYVCMMNITVSISVYCIYMYLCFVCMYVWMHNVLYFKSS